MKLRCALIVLAALASSLPVFAADTIIGDNISGNQYLVTPLGKRWTAGVTYTTDGASNPVPIMGATGGTVTADQGAAGASAWPVSLAALPAPAGRASVGLIRNVYSTTPVTTAAYVELVASTADVVNEIFIFDSSGQTLVLATGAVASEVDKLYIVPGGNGLVPMAVPAGTRVSIKAVSANATVGEISISFLK